MAINHFVSYLLESPDRITERELKDVVLRLRTAVADQSFAVGDLFGSEVDLWGFSIEMPSGDVLVGAWPPEVNRDGRWSTGVMQEDPGLFRDARLRRLAELKRVEWAVHKALLSDQIGARNLMWDISEGHSRRRKTRMTP